MSLKSDMDAMFKFDDELFEDDWNDGDYIHVEATAEKSGNDFGLTGSVKEKGDEGHEFEVTAAAKFNMPWANGIDSQAEVIHSNNGNTEFDLVTTLGGVSTLQTL